MENTLIKVPVSIPQAAHAMAVRLAREAGWKRDRVIWFTIRDYLEATDPDSATERLNGDTLQHVLLTRQLKGARPAKRPRYLVPGMFDPTTCEMKSMWQYIPQEWAAVLRKLPAYYGVTVGDLAVAALLWATGADEPSADGANAFAPRADPFIGLRSASQTEAEVDPLDLLRQAARDKREREAQAAPDSALKQEYVADSLAAARLGRKEG